nr:MAG TPA: hypothetical protein [Caudoviricetes sp.]
MIAILDNFFKGGVIGCLLSIIFAPIIFLWYLIKILLDLN